jgi:uncharacterized membrane protein (UPF0127 family)
VKAIVIIAAVTGLAACTGTDSHPDHPPSQVTFEGNDAILHVEVADTPDARRQGMMGLQDLPTDQGMAFVFDRPVESTFWMKDTVIPLTIAFVDQEGRVIGVRDMEPCWAEPCPRYGVEEPYVLAVEANLGWFRDHEIGPGDRAELKVMAYL